MSPSYHLLKAKSFKSFLKIGIRKYKMGYAHKGANLSMKARHQLIPISYHSRKYPTGINPAILEIPAHFDVNPLEHLDKSYCLHTEYSYKSRAFTNSIFSKFTSIKEAVKDGIPRLWYSQLWSEQFADFIKHIVNSNKDPDIIEIHPPFNDYCKSKKDFIDIYKSFEDKIIRYYPGVKIFLENRCGSSYRGGRFLVTKTHDILELAEEIEHSGCKLKIAVDVIQLLSAHGGCRCMNTKKMFEILHPLKQCVKDIWSIHVWGKKVSEKGRTVSHIGDLNTCFGDSGLKADFLGILKDVFNDSMPRYFVPEVNSGDEDLKSIVNDFIDVGFIFL